MSGFNSYDDLEFSYRYDDLAFSYGTEGNKNRQILKHPSNYLLGSLLKQGLIDNKFYDYITRECVLNGYFLQQKRYEEYKKGCSRIINELFNKLQENDRAKNFFNSKDFNDRLISLSVKLIANQTKYRGQGVSDMIEYLTESINILKDFPGAKENITAAVDNIQIINRIDKSTGLIKSSLAADIKDGKELFDAAKKEILSGSLWQTEFIKKMDRILQRLQSGFYLKYAKNKLDYSMFNVNENIVYYKNELKTMQSVMNIEVLRAMQENELSMLKIKLDPLSDEDLLSIKKEFIDNMSNKINAIEKIVTSQKIELNTYLAQKQKQQRHDGTSVKPLADELQKSITGVVQHTKAVDAKELSLEILRKNILDKATQLVTIMGDKGGSFKKQKDELEKLISKWIEQEDQNISVVLSLRIAFDNILEANSLSSVGQFDLANLYLKKASTWLRDAKYDMNTVTLKPLNDSTKKILDKFVEMQSVLVGKDMRTHLPDQTEPFFITCEKLAANSTNFSSLKEEINNLNDHCPWYISNNAMFMKERIILTVANDVVAIEKLLLSDDLNSARKLLQNIKTNLKKVHDHTTVTGLQTPLVSITMARFFDKMITFAINLEQQINSKPMTHMNIGDKQQPTSKISNASNKSKNSKVSDEEFQRSLRAMALECKKLLAQGLKVDNKIKPDIDVIKSKLDSYIKDGKLQGADAKKCKFYVNII